MTMLEVGAGHGGYTEAALACGSSVTATEMSRPSLARMTERFGMNPTFSAVFDPEGTLGTLGRSSFSVILCASVLHHIPDYVGFLDRSALEHLAPGGTLISVQDPLWYPGMSTSSRLLTKAAYLWWRVGQGSYVQGVRTQLRRARRVYDEDSAQDMVEYHVVRSGVDQNLIVDLLSARFEAVALIRYWSTQSSIWQRIGESMGWSNTFAVVARGFAGPGAQARAPTYTSST